MLECLNQSIAFFCLPRTATQQGCYSPQRCKKQRLSTIAASVCQCIVALEYAFSLRVTTEMKTAATREEKGDEKEEKNRKRARNTRAIQATLSGGEAQLQGIWMNSRLQ